MAPMTRSGLSLAAQSSNFMSSQSFREGSWDFAGSEPRSEGSHASEERASYDGEDGDYEYGNTNSQTSPPLLEGPDVHDDILHPLREAANRVGREVERFAEVLDGYNPLKAIDDVEKQDMTFDLLDLYYEIAVETVEHLREKHASDASRSRIQDTDMTDADETGESGDDIGSKKTTIQDLYRWEQEAQTWDLMRRMASLQYPQHDPSNDKISQLHPYSSERQVWDAFLEAEPLALERDTVLRWLKDSAEDQGEDIDDLVHDLQQNAERGDIIAHGWLHTKAAIKNQKRIHVWPQVLDPSSPDVQRVHLNSSRTEPLVTQLDPDAPLRQGRKLEAQDEYFERAIWLGCFEMLRRGKSAEEIREWCRDRTEIWRAVSMSGLPENEPSSDKEIFDNSSRALWRRMCFALARRSSGDEYERAVYGILSGDLSSVEQVCQSWDDVLFAHYNSLLKSQYEAFLRVHYPNRVPADVVQSFGIFDALQFHGEAESVSKRLIGMFKSNPELRDEMQQPMKLIQSVLVSKTFGDFIYQQGLALSKYANVEFESKLIARLDVNPVDEENTAYITLGDFDSLRVLTHLLLAFKSLGLDLGSEIQQYASESIIVAYISFLRLAGKEELIPLYASQLSEDRSYATLSRELIDVTDPDQRMTQIRLMKELGLDVQKFVRYQTRFLFADNPDNEKGYPALGNFSILHERGPREALTRKFKSEFIGDDIDRTDLLLIRSLEWHLLVEGLWSETFRTGALLYKRFFKHMKLAAARELATQVSSYEISKTKTSKLLGESLDIAGLEADNEDEDITQRIDGSLDQSRMLKKQMLAESKSFQDLEKLIQALDFIEGSASIVEVLEDSTLDDKAKKDVRVQFFKNFPSIKDSVNALLRDWLVTTQDEEPDFPLIREAYLPEVILAYNSVLHFAGMLLSRDNFLECMDLATIVAAEDSDLADLFVKTGRMPDLVQALAGNSANLLYSTGPGKSRPGPSKKLREKGWTRDLWNIKL